MGAVKCLPQKEQEKEEEPEEKVVGSTPTDTDADELQQQLRELRRKYEESQKQLKCQLNVHEEQEKRIAEFQALSEKSKSELQDLQSMGGSTVALSQTMMKFAKGGKGNAAARKVNFLHTDIGENIVILTTESTGAVKQFTVQGVSTDPKTASLSKLKKTEGERMLIMDCEGKKIPLLVESKDIRDKWYRTISNCLARDVKE